MAAKKRKSATVIRFPVERARKRGVTAIELLELIADGLRQVGSRRVRITVRIGSRDSIRDGS